MVFLSLVNFAKPRRFLGNRGPDRFWRRRRIFSLSGVSDLKHWRLTSFLLQNNAYFFLIKCPIPFAKTAFPVHLYRVLVSDDTFLENFHHPIVMFLFSISMDVTGIVLNSHYEVWWKHWKEPQLAAITRNKISETYVHKVLIYSKELFVYSSRKECI